MLERLAGNVHTAAAVFMTDDARAARSLLGEKEVFRDLEGRATEAHFARIRAGAGSSTSIYRRAPHLGVATSARPCSARPAVRSAVAVRRHFATTLASNIATALPAGSALPAAIAPATIEALPNATRSLYLTTFTDALRPVFLRAGAMAALGFGLTWSLKPAPPLGDPNRLQPKLVRRLRFDFGA